MKHFYPSCISFELFLQLCKILDRIFSKKVHPLGEGQGLPHVESYYGIMPVQEPVTEVTSHVTRPFVTSSAPNSEYMPESDRSTDDEEEDIE